MLSRGLVELRTSALLFSSCSSSVSSESSEPLSASMDPDAKRGRFDAAGGGGDGEGELRGSSEIVEPAIVADGEEQMHGAALYLAR